MGPNVEKLRKCRSIVEIHNVVQSIRTSTTKINRSLSAMYTSGRKRLNVSLSVKDESVKLTQGRKGQKLVVDKAVVSDLTGVKLQNYTAPNASTLAKHSELLHKLHGNEADLNAAEGMLLHSFTGSAAQKNVLTAIKALKKETQVGLDKAFSILNNVGVNHMPDEMSSVTAEVSQFVTDHIPKTAYTVLHDDMDYVVPADTSEFPKDEFHFCHYTQFKNLRNDKGFVFENFFFILTGVVNTAGVMRFYLNAFPNFIAPGHYPIGKAIANIKDIEKRLHFLMLHNDISTEFETKPLAMSDKDLTTKGFRGIPGVESVILNNNMLTVKLQKSKSDSLSINRVVSTVLPLLTFHAGGHTSNIVHKPRVASGFTYIDFKLTPKRKLDSSGEKALVDVAKLSELQHVLGLTDVQLTAVKKALRPFN